MAYGVSVTNSSGHKIIQDTQPIYALKRSGTLSQYKTSNVGSTPYTSVGLPHLYGYQVQGTNADPSGTEEVFFEVDVGGWIAYNAFSVFISDGQTTAYDVLVGSDVTSTMSGGLDYYVFDKMDSISGAGAASGYGMQVFNASGTVMWDSNEITNRVDNGYTISSTTTINSTANAGSIRAWYCTIRSGSGFANGGHTNVNNWYLKRLSTTQWQVAVGVTNYAFYPYQGGWYNFATATDLVTGNARVLLAHV